MGLLKFSDYKKSRIEVKEAKNKELANKKFNEKLKTKLTDLGVTSIAELDEDQMTNLLDSLKPSVEESNMTEMMSVKEACGKMHEMAKMYESDDSKDHTYEAYMKEAMEMLKEMYESYMKEMKESSNETNEAEKVKCPKCDGKGCEHCDNTGYHMKESVNEDKLEEGMIGIKTDRGFTPKDFEDALKKGGVNIDKMNRLSMTLTMLKTDDVDKAKKVISDFKGTSLMESKIEEKEIKSDEEFKEYGQALLKKAFGDDYDEEKAMKTIEGILKKVDGDYGAAVGTIQASLD